MRSAIVRLDLQLVPSEVSLSKQFTIIDENVGCLLLLMKNWHLYLSGYVMSICQLGNFKGLYLNGFYIKNAWETLKAPLTPNHWLQLKRFFKVMHLTGFTVI